MIANRGEIALRIMRACQQEGIESVIALSEADANGFVASKAEKVVLIGPAPARESYLSIDKIVAAAKAESCDAVHPGYGFLSENAEFASRVIEAGLVFIGPTPESIRAMGSKTEARKTVLKAGVPVAPGTEGGLSDADLLTKASEIGFPLIIKATAGGGGRGMRVVRSLEDLEQNLPRARGEVLKNFGSDDIFLERYIELPRHVEVQIAGDGFGSVIHFGTRDCSTQRRHQKLIEEAPAPNLSAKLRHAIESAAVLAGRSVNYKNLGTCEFLVSGEKFYFLEMNTRIQVEHPVTEEITGVDLVRLQLRIAQWAKLPYTQDQIKFRGHAIEFRVNAEDPANSFTPARGTITKLELPPGARYEMGYTEGSEIPLHYDGLIGKVIVKGQSRIQAITKSLKILSRCAILGVPTSLDLAPWVLENGLFRSGSLDIGFVEREFNREHLGTAGYPKGAGLHNKSGNREQSAVQDLRASNLTPEQLLQEFRRELAVKEYRDPAHQDALECGPRGEIKVERKHFYDYESKQWQGPVTIEVKHKSDGFFVATPIMNGRRAQGASRMSNGLRQAIDSVITVLEETPKDKIVWN